jgi:AraC-like DNA-binding protein
MNVGIFNTDRRIGEPTMLFLHKPAAPLDRFIECLWHSAGYAPSHDRERVLPTGTVELVFNLRDDPIQIFADECDTAGGRFGGAVVTGARSHYFVLETSQQAAVAGVHFRPGGAAPFLGVPLSEIMDRHVRLEDIWGGRAALLRQRLQEAETSSALFAVLEDALRERLLELRPGYVAVIDAARRIASDPTVARVRRISDRTGYSPKRFIRLFHDAVGLTPKLYCRVQRFQRLLHAITAGGCVEWAQAAVDCGYCDQSHMIRDFRAFAGVTPLAYRPVAADRRNHVALT